MHRLINGIVTAIAFIVLMGIICAPAYSKTKDDAVTAVADPIVYLDIEGVGSCTGFVSVAFDAKVIVTAGHCAEDAAGKTVTAKDGVGRTFAVHFIYLDMVHDLSIFVPNAGIVAGPIAASPLACDVPVQIGDDISMTGFPADFGKVTTFGKVAAMPSPWGGIWPEVYRMNIFGGPGNSGSPVYNKSGQVIAILVGGDPQYIGMSLAVPVSEICHPRIA